MEILYFRLKCDDCINCKFIDLTDLFFPPLLDNEKSFQIKILKNNLHFYLVIYFVVVVLSPVVSKQSFHSLWTFPI